MEATKDQDTSISLVVEIHALTVPRLTNNIIEHKDGVIIGDIIYLPYKWNEFDTKTKFLESLCKDASLGNECWKDNEVRTFRTTSFNEDILAVRI